MKKFLSSVALCLAIVTGCVKPDADHAKVFVSSSLTFVEGSKVAPTPNPQPLKDCPTCKNTGCVLSGDRQSKVNCPHCTRTCNSARQAPDTIGGRTRDFFVRPQLWIGKDAPDPMVPKVGDRWLCADNVVRQWGPNGQWQVQRCYGRGRCQWEDEQWTDLSRIRR